MYALAIVLAVLGALLIAIGAALQERVAVRVPSTRGRLFGFFERLLDDPRWVAGALLAGCGVGIHMVALSNGPVTAIQPVGTVGLLFAIGTKAFLDHTGVPLMTVLGSLAVVLGLIGLLFSLPPGSGSGQLPLGKAVIATLCALVLTAVALTVPASTVKAGLLALGAGLSFGVSAAFIGVIGRRVGGNVAAVIGWPTVLAAILLIVGGTAQQLAYRQGRFAVVYAVLLVADPLSASITGIFVLGDPAPRTATGITLMSVGATVTVIGIAVLTHVRATNRSRAERSQLCAS